MNLYLKCRVPVPIFLSICVIVVILLKLEELPLQNPQVTQQQHPVYLLVKIVIKKFNFLQILIDEDWPGAGAF